MTHTNHDIQVCEISFEDACWDSLVSKCNGYVFFQKKYLAAFSDEDMGMPIMLVIGNGEESSVCVCFKRDIAKDQYFRGKIQEGRFFDLMSPYGYGGYVGSFKDKNLLMQIHFEFCKNKGYVSEVVKFHPLSDYIESYNGNLETSFHNVVRDLKGDYKDVWMDYKAKVRKNVKRAQDNNLSILIDEKGEFLDEFLDIYYSTMNRNNASKGYYFSKKFFYMLSKMQDAVCYFHTVCQGKIISTELVLYDSRYCYSFLGGTDSEYYHLRPNDFLKNGIIEWGLKKGLSHFILGGGHGCDDGIFDYKKTFAPHGVVNFYIGTNIFSEESYEFLCAIRKSIDEDFDSKNKVIPAYRW